MHTAPVSPSSYSVKPSICRYPWKRSLFTHDDKLASSYSATQRERQRQNPSEAQKKAHWHSGHNLSILKAEQNMKALTERSQCVPSVRSAADKEQHIRGLLNNYQKFLWQRAACGWSSDGGYSGSETAQLIVTQWADWESIQRPNNQSASQKEKNNKELIIQQHFCSGYDSFKWRGVPSGVRQIIIIKQFSYTRQNSK